MKKRIVTVNPTKSIRALLLLYYIVKMPVRCNGYKQKNVCGEFLLSKTVLKILKSTKCDFLKQVHIINEYF